MGSVGASSVLAASMRIAFVRDVTVDGVVVVVVLLHAHLLASRGPSGGPRLCGRSRPEQPPLTGAQGQPWGGVGGATAPGL
jgi:hypothetical protein